MILKTCLRCDWQGGTKERDCPNCGVPLYVVGASPSGGAGEPVRDRPEERSREAASTASVAPSGAPFPESSSSPSPADALEPTTRSARSAVQRRSWWPAGRFAETKTSAKLAIAAAALVVVAVVSINLLPASGGRGSGPSPSTTPRPSQAPTPAGVGPIEGPLIGRQSLTVDGVPFSFSVPASGWEGSAAFISARAHMGHKGRRP